MLRWSVLYYASVELFYSIDLLPYWCLRYPSTCLLLVRYLIQLLRFWSGTHHLLTDRTHLLGLSLRFGLVYLYSASRLLSRSSLSECPSQSAGFPRFDGIVVTFEFRKPPPPHSLSADSSSRSAGLEMLWGLSPSRLCRLSNSTGLWPSHERLWSAWGQMRCQNQHFLPLCYFYCWSTHKNLSWAQRDSLSWRQAIPVWCLTLCVLSFAFETLRLELVEYCCCL